MNTRAVTRRDGTGVPLQSAPKSLEGARGRHGVRFSCSFIHACTWLSESFSKVSYFQSGLFVAIGCNYCAVKSATVPYRSTGTGAESGKNVVPIGRKEISVFGPGNPRTGREAAATQHLAGAEPRL